MKQGIGGSCDHDLLTQEGCRPLKRKGISTTERIIMRERQLSPHSNPTDLTRTSWQSGALELLYPQLDLIFIESEQ